MGAVIAFITLVINEVVPLIPTISADASLAVSLISGARSAINAISSSSPEAITTDQFKQLDAAVAALEGTWAAQLAEATKNQG